MSERIPIGAANAKSAEENSSKKTHFLERLDAPATKAFNKLRTDIESGAIGSIIGIDGSGRVAALLAREVIRIVYEHKGLKSAQTRFFAGRADWEAIREHLKDNPLEKDRKVLVVDDTLATGNSVKPIIQALDALGYQSEFLAIHGATYYDTISFERPEPDEELAATTLKAADEALDRALAPDSNDEEREKASQENMELYRRYSEEIVNVRIPLHGGSLEDNSPLTNRSELSGVEKQGGVWGSGIKTEGIHAVPYRSPEVPLVRKEVKELAEKITSSWI